MSNTSTIHIKTDFDCKVYDYGQEIGTTKADIYFNVELRKGEHELTFAFTGDESVSKTINYMVEDVDCDYRLILEIKEIVWGKAIRSYNSEDYASAFFLFRIVAEYGDAEAQYRLGNCFKYGDGIESDREKAIEWYLKAAEQGHTEAQCDLGLYYYNNNDFEKAVEWYKKAAEQEYPDGQYHLGWCYEHGYGVEKDSKKAIDWYIKAGDFNSDLRLQVLSHYLFFDTETTGIPREYNVPTSNSSNWPRLVQLSWITTDEECNIISENDFIIYPDGFTIPTDAAHLHGITTSIAKEKGWPLEEVIYRFMEDFNAATTIVGHNVDFDKKIIGAELIRLGLNDIMSSKEALCTMKGSVDYCKIPSSHGYKWPKLQELHKKLFGCEFEDAHNSMSDVKATLKCFKEMKKLGWI